MISSETIIWLEQRHMCILINFASMRDLIFSCAHFLSRDKWQMSVRYIAYMYKYSMKKPTADERQ